MGTRPTDDPAAATPDDPVHVVEVLLTQAGLTVPAEEVQRLAQIYPGLRRSVDRFYDIDVGDEVPAAVFRADDPSPARASDGVVS